MSKLLWKAGIDEDGAGDAAAGLVANRFRIFIRIE